MARKKIVESEQLRETPSASSSTHAPDRNIKNDEDDIEHNAHVKKDVSAHGKRKRPEDADSEGDNDGGDAQSKPQNATSNSDDDDEDVGPGPQLQATIDGM
jgi:hypothetical protein